MVVCVCAPQTADVQSRLMDLLESKCMAFSIRLLILKALDASLRFPNGVRWFLGSHLQQAKSQHKEPATAYQRIVQLMTKKQVKAGAEGEGGVLCAGVPVGFFSSRSTVLSTGEVGGKKCVQKKKKSARFVTSISK